MENPGSIRIGKKQILKGGISDPRNKALMKMFNLISNINTLNALFEEFGFEKFIMKYEYGGVLACYRAPDGFFYRVDHFDHFYVIEDAENETEARVNRFEDTDLFEDSLPEEELKEQIRAWVRKYVLEND